VDETHDGGRGVRGFARPYVRAAQGRLLRQAFDVETRTFEAVIDVAPTVQAPTHVAVPGAAYSDGAAVETSSACRIEIVEGAAIIFCSTAGEMRITVRPAG
jgi:hypothetical protein